MREATACMKTSSFGLLPTRSTGSVGAGFSRRLRIQDTIAEQQPFVRGLGCYIVLESLMGAKNSSRSVRLARSFCDKLTRFLGECRAVKEVEREHDSERPGPCNGTGIRIFRA